MYSNKKKVAIIYIATREYIQFWNIFYSSSEQFFCVDEDIQKHYFIFTNKENIDNNLHETEYIHIIPIQALGPPLDTMLRFHYMLSIKDILDSFDYILFFNANLQFLHKVHSSELLPNDTQDLAFTIFDFDKNIPSESYESYEQSMAYIPPDKHVNYYRGGLITGKKTAFIQMSLFITKYIEKDLSANYIPIWHDESYLNRYIYEHEPPYKEINANIYMYPEGWLNEEGAPTSIYETDAKMLLFDKQKKFDSSFIQNKYYTKKINTYIQEWQYNVHDLENQIYHLQDNFWYRFGQMPKKQKVIILIQIIIKKILRKKQK